MADSLFKVSAKWEGDIQKEFEENLFAIDRAVDYGLSSVDISMRYSLLEHIQHDVYDAYTPSAYPRRSDPGGETFGRPLNDLENMDSHKSQIGKDYVYVFLYYPSGSHSGKIRDAKDYKNEKGQTNPQYVGRDDYPIKPHPLHGDALIERIQTANYDWNLKKKIQSGALGGRPFWNNFVDEQRNGMLFAAFEDGFSGRGFDLVREGGIKDLDFPASESMLDAETRDGNTDSWNDPNW